MGRKRVIDAADNIDAAAKRYFQSEKGKAALAKTQSKYYQEKKKPEREMVNAFLAWQKQHPQGTIEEFLKGQDSNE